MQKQLGVMFCGLDNFMFGRLPVAFGLGGGGLCPLWSLALTPEFRPKKIHNLYFHQLQNINHHHRPSPSLFNVLYNPIQ